MRIFHLKTSLSLFFGLFILSSCDTNQFKVNTSDIPQQEIEIHDYARALFMLNQDSLKRDLGALQKEFSLFLGDQSLKDEQVIQLNYYINDPFLMELFSAYQKAFPSMEPIEKELDVAFQHLIYYYPNIQLPEVYAYISGVQDPVIFQENILVLGLDNYLGADCEIYNKTGIPRYRINSMTPEYIVRDAMIAMGMHEIEAPAADAMLLEFMIYEAKKLYFVNSMLPEIEDQILQNYTPEQLKWFSDKESDLWKYYIENELLFKRDYESLKKFINDAPFTSVFGNNTPPRTGIWLGYKILKGYAGNNKVSLKEVLLNTDAQEILKKSKFKPGR